MVKVTRGTWWKRQSLLVPFYWRSPIDGGPCFDFCACSFCWNGWDNLPLWRKLWQHLLWRVGYCA